MEKKLWKIYADYGVLLAAETKGEAIAKFTQRVLTPGEDFSIEPVNSLKDIPPEWEDVYTPYGQDAEDWLVDQGLLSKYKE